MGIRDFLNRLREKKLRAKEFTEDMNAQERYYEKKKSANERELERYLEEERQRKIKEDLEAFRKARRNEYEYGHQILKVKNMYKGEKNTMLKQKNLFTHKNSIMHKEALFFK